MSEKDATVLSLLMDLEASMRNRGFWQSGQPPAEAFESSLPFFVDRMDFIQWLQFVFLPTIRQRIESGEPLPPECAIAPMAEIHFAEANLQAQELISLLVEIDQCISET